MTKLEVPHFHNPALRQAADDSLATLQTLPLQLDQISDDIEAVERFLNEAGVRTRWGVGGHRAGLTWELAEPDRWRVGCYYLEARTLNAVRRAFIEAPAAIRLELVGLLPELVRSIATAQHHQTEPSPAPGPLAASTSEPGQ